MQTAKKISHHYTLIPRTLILITSDNHILLLKGAPTKPIWPNLYNGLGGHVERGETIEEAARREVQEETGLTAIDAFRLCGTITIDTNTDTGIILFVFTGTSKIRTTRPSSEGTPEWLPTHMLPSLPCVDDLPDLVTRIAHTSATQIPFHIHYQLNEHNHPAAPNAP